jgi:enoyl-CoA hydratase
VGRAVPKLPAVSRYDAYTEFRFERPHDGVLRIVFDTPPMNALSQLAHRQIADLWIDVERDPEVRVAIITGAGKAFSAGGSWDIVEDLATLNEARLRGMREARDLVVNMLHCSKPIISAINGPAVGAGLVAAILADITIAGRRAKLIDGHTRLGVVAGDHAAIAWPLLCGMAKTKYYLLTCTPLSGEEAERIGLVSLCVDDDVLQDTALEIAVGLAEGAQSAIRWTKQSLNHWYTMFSAAFDASLALEFLSFSGPDALEGLNAAREKRTPTFTGPAGD